MAVTNTTSQGTKVKVQTPSRSVLEIQVLSDITMNLIDQYFPMLKKAPDIKYVSMAIWGQESDWKIWPNGRDSRHFTPTRTGGNTITGRYTNSPEIQNLLKSNPNPTILKNINDGYYPHGISASMGPYHVRGTPDNRSEFGAFRGVVSDLGLEVGPGESITELFPNTVQGKIRSIASGLIILSRKFEAGLRKYPTSDAALKYAIQAYVGGTGLIDAGGLRPEQRLTNVYARSSTRSQLLAEAGITSGGSTAGENASVSASSRELIATAKTKSAGGSVQNDQTRTPTGASTGTGIVQC